MLAGIAGSTIEEARERMPVDEIRIWQAYIAKNGPLATQRRLEYTAALLAMLLANQNRGEKAKPLELERFLLWQRPELPDSEPEDFQQAFGELMKVSSMPADGKPKKKLWVRRAA